MIDFVNVREKAEACFYASIFLLIIIIYIFLQALIKLVAIPLALFGKGQAKQYGINVWEGFDNSASADTGGDPDETISSRLGKARNNNSKALTFIANKVDLVAKELFGDLNHSEKSIERDEGRKQVTGR